MIEILLSLAVLGVLSSGFLLLLKKLGLFSSSILLLFCIALCIHLGATFFIHYTNFYPFGGGQGDQYLYHGAAVTIAVDFQQGIFSVERIQEALTAHRMQHWYPVLLGMLYALTLPALIVGKILSVWFVCVAITLLFLISRELGATERGAFIAGLLGSLYPSFLYFGSLLLRESAIVALVLLASFLLLKCIKEFSWQKFFALYAVFLVLVHLRFYVGIVAVSVAAFSLFFFQKISWDRRSKEAFVVVLLLGFVPQLSGYGYYGMNAFITFLHPEKIQTYRETAYVPRDIPQTQPKAPEPIPQEPVKQEPVKPEPKGQGSTVVVKVDTKNPLIFVAQNLVSFVYVTLGPFPWHIKYSRQLFVLLETIPWIFLFLLNMLGAFSAFRNRWRQMLPIILIAYSLLFMISLFMDNFGVYMRIRMPAFLLLLALAPLSFPLLGRLVKRI